MDIFRLVILTNLFKTFNEENILSIKMIFFWKNSVRMYSSIQLLKVQDNTQKPKTKLLIHLSSGVGNRSLFV